MLEKLKDIFYDKNDIIVALIILLAAGFIITHQVEAIMSYPEQLAAELQESAAKPVDGDTTDPDQTVEPPEVQQPETQDPETQGPSSEEPNSNAQEPNSGEFKTAVARTIQIPSGSHSASIAAILANAGVIPSQDAFLDAIVQAGVETKLKAGTFQIPAGSTLSDVVSILTR